MEDLLNKISNPASRALKAVGITEISQLDQYSEAELLKLHGVGPKSIRTIQAELQKIGLQLKK